MSQYIQTILSSVTLFFQLVNYKPKKKNKMKRQDQIVSFGASNNDTWGSIGTAIGEAISEIIDIIVDEVFGETKEK